MTLQVKLEGLEKDRAALLAQREQEYAALVQMEELDMSKQVAALKRAQKERLDSHKEKTTDYDYQYTTSIGDQQALVAESEQRVQSLKEELTVVQDTMTRFQASLAHILTGE